MKRWLALTASLVISSGCAHTFQKDFARLRPGMSTEEVRQELGDPWDTKTEVSEGMREEYWVYSYAVMGDPDMWIQSDYGNLTWLHFSNGSLVRYGDAAKGPKTNIWFFVTVPIR